MDRSTYIMQTRQFTWEGKNFLEIPLDIQILKFRLKFQKKIKIYPSFFRYCIGNHFDNETEEIDEITLICFDEEQMAAENFKFFMKGILIMVSVIFLLITLYVYWLLPELRETQDKVTIGALICLTIFMFCLGLLQIVTPLIHVNSYCLLLGIGKNR